MSEAKSIRQGLPPRRAAWVAGGLVFVNSLLGQLATFPNLVPWYAGLTKPGFTPPNGVYGPVWTLLYALMALAFWRILILPQQSGRKLAIVLFLVQLALNVLWSYCFFAAHSPLLGLIDILPQLFFVAADLSGFSAAQPHRRPLPAAAGPLGRLRRGAQFRDLAVERIGPAYRLLLARFSQSGM